MSSIACPSNDLTVRQASANDETIQPHLPRDPQARLRYLEPLRSQIPRLLGAIDRNPFHPTFGCLDRQYWHYRTIDFPSEMYQEGVLALALVYLHPWPGNVFHNQERVRDLAIAALRFAAKSSHRDGSCDDYYPWERALGAAAFSLRAAAETYRLLELNEPEVLVWLERRASWLMCHDESGHLANHQALAALGLAQVAQLTGQGIYQQASESRLHKLFGWQSSEGWFEEYGGADPGYQSVTIDCLAKYRELTGARWFDEPLRRAVCFARQFLHPDDSYGGEYGSRGTYHFYPHGCELLANWDWRAADLADGYLRSMVSGRQAWFEDDRLFAHRLVNLLEAYRDWSAQRHAAPTDAIHSGLVSFPQAGLLVHRTAATCTIISTARGGTFKHFRRGQPVQTDTGLVVELDDGRQADSARHHSPRIEPPAADAARSEAEAASKPPDAVTIRVSGLLRATRLEVATPLKLVIFRLAMWSVGRWCRNLVRRVLQRRVISGGRTVPVRLTRSFALSYDEDSRRHRLQVTDDIELVDPSVRVRRLALASDHQAAYTAATGIFHEHTLCGWHDLGKRVAELNERRRVRIVRQWDH